MAVLPPESTPLNQHSLPALEAWLQQLGAVRMDDNACQWMLERSEWRALLLLEREDLKVIWHPGSLEAMVQCSLCLLYTSPSPRDAHESRMPSSA